MSTTPPPFDPIRPAALNPPSPPPQSQSITPGTTLVQSCLIAGCVTVFVPMLLVFGGLLLAGYVISSGMDESAGGWSALYQSSGETNLNEKLLRKGDDHAGTIAIVAVQGTIEGNGSPLHSDGMMDFVAAQLRAAKKNDAVKAVILQIDSPGGGLTASDQLHHEVQLFRESGKPVIAWAGSAMTSGAYYIAVAAEEIMANPTATIGSIGVVMQHFQAGELLGKIGVEVDPITSVVHKDIGSPFRKMTPEERGILQDYVDGAHSRFIDIVADGRKMDPERVRELADGSIVMPSTALERGLIDSIGYIDDAIALVEKRLGEADMRVIGYKRVFTLGDLFSGAGAAAAESAVKAVKEADTSPKAMAVP